VSSLEVAVEQPRSGYSRDEFGGWVDNDGDGCDTRCEVLAQERVGTLPGLPAGGWRSAYDGYTTPDPSELDIDHVVALGEAWDSGAAQWSANRRSEFANAVGPELWAVTAASNRSKGDDDPAEWQPPERSSWCEFANRWVAVKVKWELTADAAEVKALTQMLKACRS
jgi:hypothetical protein